MQKRFFAEIPIAISPCFEVFGNIWTSAGHEYLWEGGSICQHLLLLFFLCVFELVCCVYFTGWRRTDATVVRILLTQKSSLQPQILFSGVKAAGLTVTSAGCVFGYLKTVTKPMIILVRGHRGLSPPTTLTLPFPDEPSDLCHEKPSPDGRVNQNLSSSLSLLRFIIRCSSLFGSASPESAALCF